MQFQVRFFNLFVYLRLHYAFLFRLQYLLYELVLVLCLVLLLRVVGDVDGRLVVHGQTYRRIESEAQLTQEIGEVDGLLGCLGTRHKFGLTGGEGDARLLFGSPADACRSEVE